MNEIWKDIPGYEGEYQVSTLGRVRSVDRFIFNKFNAGRIRKQSETRKHLFVTLYRRQKGKSRWVHRLVLEAFIGPQPPGMQACHNDGNGLNNALTNLRWDTPINNCADRTSHGRTCMGNRCHKAKLTEKDVLNIRTDVRPINDIARAYGITHGNVWFIKNGLTWKHIS